MILGIHKIVIFNILCISVVYSHKTAKLKKCNVTVWLIQCHGFENDSNGTVTVYLRHFTKMPDIGFPCNRIKTT